MPRCPLCGRADGVVENGMDGYYCFECAYTFHKVIMKIIEWLF